MTVQHTGTRSIASMFSCETQHIGHDTFQRAFATSHDLIAPLRNPVAVAQSWANRDRCFSSMASQWDWLIRSPIVHYVPMDTPDREEYLLAAGPDLYTGTWPHLGQWAVDEQDATTREMTRDELVILAGVLTKHYDFFNQYYKI